MKIISGWAAMAIILALIMSVQSCDKETAFGSDQWFDAGF